MQKSLIDKARGAFWTSFESGLIFDINKFGSLHPSDNRSYKKIVRPMENSSQKNEGFKSLSMPWPWQKDKKLLSDIWNFFIKQYLNVWPPVTKHCLTSNIRSSRFWKKNHYILCLYQAKTSKKCLMSNVFLCGQETKHCCQTYVWTFSHVTKHFLTSNIRSAMFLKKNQNTFMLV